MKAPTLNRGRQLSGRASSAAGIGGLAALTMVTDGRGTTAVLVIAAVALTLHLLITAMVTAVVTRIALSAARAGEDPVQLVRVLISFLRATR
jgi:hypothetical protein